MAQKMTEKQTKFLRSAAKGFTPTEAARLAGYSYPGEAAQYLMRQSHIVHALHEKRNARIQGDLSTLALETLHDLLTPKTPAATRFQASKYILELAGHAGGKGDDAGQGKELADMDMSELTEVIQSGESALRELAGHLQGHHVVDGQARELKTIEPDSETDNDPAHALEPGEDDAPESLDFLD